MSSLTNKRILLGVTGGIAAYKSAELIRRLQDAGAAVRVVMTPAAQQFITPLTLQALSGFPVSTDLLDPEAEAAMGHIELARWADLVFIAPASADFIAKLASGEGTDLLSTVCLAARSALAVAPAMNQAMWANLATADNIARIRDRGIHIFGPASGVQACGDQGYGRMSEPEQLAEECAKLFETGELAGKRVVITAGPTREALDPVRYLSNHSSGKMGYALAEALAEAGARTTLISGPVSINAPERVELVNVESAVDMYEAALTHASGADIFIAAAAVADFRVKDVAKNKIKKGSEDSMTLQLVKNPDILASVSELEARPFCVGFAAETDNVVDYARAKLERKNLDLIIANDVSQASIGFNSDDNAVTVLAKSGSAVEFDQRSKAQLARVLISHIANVYPNEVC